MTYTSFVKKWAVVCEDILVGHELIHVHGHGDDTFKEWVDAMKMLSAREEELWEQNFSDELDVDGRMRCVGAWIGDWLRGRNTRTFRTITLSIRQQSGSNLPRIIRGSAGTICTRISDGGYRVPAM